MLSDHVPEYAPFFDGTYLIKICTGILTVGGTYSQIARIKAASDKKQGVLTIQLN